MEEFRKQFKDIDEHFMTTEMRVPEILYLANKCENGYEGDVLGDFY